MSQFHLITLRDGTFAIHIESMSIFNAVARVFLLSKGITTDAKFVSVQDFCNFLEYINYQKHTNYTYRDFNNDLLNRNPKMVDDYKKHQQEYERYMLPTVASSANEAHHF